GGQQQRVAIARALVTRPEVLFGDEPTGALDSTAGRVVLGLLRAMTEEGRTVIMVTHDPVAASFADRVVFLADGRIRDELDAPTAERVAARMAANAAPASLTALTAPAAPAATSALTASASPAVTSAPAASAATSALTAPAPPAATAPPASPAALSVLSVSPAVAPC
ncbi:ATP-binding cassette domain-containing protein, partial [Streptomyces anulatus]|uniref:ATP-binding cassette domain-containing protein n=1 Tax=Streptomyces anulatus TaxID=1892 RepID=UPI001EF2CFBE